MTLQTFSNKEGIQGEIHQTFTISKFGTLTIVDHTCPFCPPKTPQPVRMVVVPIPQQGTHTYTCSECNMQFRYEKGKPVVLIAKRFRTRKPFILLYQRALEEKWFLNRIDLQNPEIVEEEWTMAVEVCGQLFQKEMTGKAPGTSIGAERARLETAYLDGEIFRQSLLQLKDKGYMEYQEQIINHTTV